MKVSYALRDDPLNIYMLSEGVANSDKYTQIFLLKKKPISNDFLDDYYYLDCKKADDVGLTNLAKEVRSYKWNNPYKYVAHVESQIEIKISQNILEKFSESLFPLWTVPSILNYFDDQDYGYIIILKVYSVNQRLDTSLLYKGRQGSALVMRLYGPDDMETSVYVDGLKPLVSNMKFECIKDEIIQIVKEENSFIDMFENDADGRNRLINHMAIMQLLHPIKVDRDYDIDGDADYAQIDYDPLYDEAKRQYPNLVNFIDYIRQIRPAQFGEQKIMIDKAIHGDEAARNRLIEINMRACFRSAMWFSEQNSLDLEDCLQDALEGLITSVDKYNMSYADTPFPSYSSWWVRQRLVRNSQLLNHVRIPEHLKQKLTPIFLDYERHIKECNECSDGHFCESILSNVASSLNCSLEQANRYLNMLSTPLDIKNIYKLKNYNLEYSFEDNVLDKLKKQELKDTIDAIFNSLREKEKDVLKLRYGFNGKCNTLEEIGTRYNVTRERIRQIESKGLRKMTATNKLKSVLFEFYE